MIERNFLAIVKKKTCRTKLLNLNNRKNTRKKFIFFDFDGVIIDSFTVSFELYKSLYGSENFSEKIFRQLFKDNIYKSISQNNIKFNEKKFFRLYTSRILRLEAVPGIPDVLKKLSKQYELLVISSTFSNPIKKWLKKERLISCFSVILGADAGKNKTEKLKLFLQNQKIKPDNCLFITDTLGDLLEANKIKIKSLAVLWGFHNKQTLQKGKPFGYLKKPNELLLFINNYWKN